MALKIVGGTERKIIVLSALISLLTGCVPKRAEPPPQSPGVTFDLRYPVLLAGNHDLQVKDDKDSLITTSVASGMSFLEMKLIDSDGGLYEIRKVTPFGRKSVWRDLGTSRYQVFLELKKARPINLQQAKSLVMEVLAQRNELVSGAANGVRAATEKIQACQSLAELLEVCRTAW
jgi:hypothetical protein